MLTLTVITMFDWINDIIRFSHNAFPMSASSDKTAFAFQFFDLLYALKYGTDAW